MASGYLIAIEIKNAHDAMTASVEIKNNLD
jgi:hypothetical protein